MKALIYKDKNKIELKEAPRPIIKDKKDAIIKVTMSSICTSDLHIIKGFVPSANKEIILGHEFTGIVEETGVEVKNFKAGDRVAVNCETFCGECFFCKNKFVNNCINGGWMLGHKINGCQTEYVRVPFADFGLTKIPEGISFENALFAGDILASGYFGVDLAEVNKEDTVAIIGAGPVGLCSLICAKNIRGAKKVIVIDIDNNRLNIAKEKGADYILNPLECNIKEEMIKITAFGADKVIEAAGSPDSFKMMYEIARPNAICAVVAMYEENLVLPLPKMYGKNLIFKTGGVDNTYMEFLHQKIQEGVINTDFLISKKYKLDNIIEAYSFFEKNKGAVLKVAVEP